MPMWQIIKVALVQQSDQPLPQAHPFLLLQSMSQYKQIRTRLTSCLLDNKNMMSGYTHYLTVRETWGMIKDSVPYSEAVLYLLKENHIDDCFRGFIIPIDSKKPSLLNVHSCFPSTCPLSLHIHVRTENPSKIHSKQNFKELRGGEVYGRWYLTHLILKKGERRKGRGRMQSCWIEKEKSKHFPSRFWDVQFKFRFFNFLWGLIIIKDLSQ